MSRYIPDLDLLAAFDATINNRSTMTITKDKAKAVSDDLAKVIGKIFAKHGLTEPRVSVKYGDTFKMSLTASLVELVDGINVASPEAADYERFAANFGLKPGLLGHTVTMRGKTYTFLGVAVKRPKYPFAFRGPDGKQIMFTADIVDQLNATAE